MPTLPRRTFLGMAAAIRATSVWGRSWGEVPHGMEGNKIRRQSVSLEPEIVEPEIVRHLRIVFRWAHCPEEISGYWVNFVKTGNPNGQALSPSGRHSPTRMARSCISAIR